MDPRNRRPDLRGLTAREASDRLRIDGPNELGASKRRGLLETALGLLSEPMTLLLLMCGGFYLVLGDALESVMLLSFVVFILAITLLQNRKAERALEALRDLASPRALVIRDGAHRRVAGFEVVRDDLVVLAEGDRVPADATILVGQHLTVDESLLTGESASVRKAEWDGVLAPSRPGGDDLPFVFAGTLVVGGSAVARVHAIGRSTEIGRIGRALEVVEQRTTILQRETKKLVTSLAWIGGALSLLAAFVYVASRHDVLGGVLAGLTLAMAVLPNEFPVVVAAFLALGASRLSRHRVLARTIPAVESLGSATVLCVDKTGTITENRMRAASLVIGGVRRDLGSSVEAMPSAFRELVRFGVFASRKVPFDPMERALVTIGDGARMPSAWTIEREYPLARDLLAMTQVVDAQDRVVASKGAPEAIASLCRLEDERRAELMESVRDLANDGLRVIAVARGRLSREQPIPEDVRAIPFELLGLVGLVDPVRRDVPAAIAECRTAGIRVAMITGDYPATAESIAREIGLDLGFGVLLGEELDALSDDALQLRVEHTNVFARVLPEQKLRLVRAFQSNGSIVAMTGDGVNDAPALKAAHIGIAMGARGTDVAREASALVLLDDDFGSLVSAVRTGRRILDNLKKALAFVLAVHVPIVGLTIAPIALGWPLVLMPIHVAFLHMVIDPACSLVFEAETSEPDIMKRPPRDPDEPLFGRRVLGFSLVQGAMVLAVTLAVFAFARHRGETEAHARALTFTTLVVANLGLIFTNRSWSRTIVGQVRTPNPWLWRVTSGTLVFLAVVVYVGPVARLFRFSPLHAIDFVACGVAGMLSIAWFEAIKMFLGGAPLGESTHRRRLDSPA